MLLAELERIQVHLSGNERQPGEGGPLPVLLCGDFNSQSDVHATTGNAVYTLLTTGALAPSHLDLDPKDTDVEQLLGPHGALPVGHGLGLYSCFAAAHGREPAFTNIKAGEFEGTLDYMLASSTGGGGSPTGGLHVVSAGPMVDRAAVVEAEGGGLPNSVVPSDHLPLTATLQFLDDPVAS